MKGKVETNMRRRFDDAGNKGSEKHTWFSFTAQRLGRGFYYFMWTCWQAGNPSILAEWPTVWQLQLWQFNLSANNNFKIKRYTFAALWGVHTALIPIARCSLMLWLIMIGPNLLGPGVCCLLFSHPLLLITNWCFHLQRKLYRNRGQKPHTATF